MNAFNNFIKVLTEDSPDLRERTSFNSSRTESVVHDQSDASIQQQQEEQELHQSQEMVSPSSGPFQPSPEQRATGLTIQRSFNRNNLDVTSVLRTVLDYYESFFRHSCLQLKLEIFRSMLYLCNSLYESKQQYESLVYKIQNNL